MEGCVVKENSPIEGFLVSTHYFYRNSTLASCIPLDSWVFETLYNLGTSSDLPWGRYVYFLRHIGGIHLSGYQRVLRLQSALSLKGGSPDLIVPLMYILRLWADLYTCVERGTVRVEFFAQEQITRTWLRLKPLAIDLESSVITIRPCNNSSIYVNQIYKDFITIVIRR